MSDQVASSSSSAGRPSLDGPSTTTTNGKSSSSHNTTTSEPEDEGWRPISNMSTTEITTELTRVREERDTYESQYRSLLSKLTTMRATLGDRLRQDAEELDRRETQIDTLTAKVDELTTLTSTLQSELVSAHEESERLSEEVGRLKGELKEKEELAGRGGRGEGGKERERELSELLEQVKLDSHGWETACLEERSRREDAEARLKEAEQGEEVARRGEQHWRNVAERESASARELSAVLQEFQSTQESELQRALGDHRTQVDSLTTSLTEYRTRAEAAETKLRESEDLASQSEKLAAQVKEKNLLIGKLRHEAVILNEHLTEALRRLRNDQSDSNVDKRLVTNLLIQFITTPRADGKRYEMLNLIAGVLGWKEEERELAGLQKAAGPRSSGVGVGRPSMNANRSVSSSSMGGVGREASVGGDESFSNLFVEFLLSEAERGKEGNQGDAEGAGTAPSTPGRLFSPTKSQFGGGTSGPSSPSKSEAGANGDAEAANKGGGGLGSYFGLSRGSKK